jgi:4-amino-4-deoxy-L-arabinose transferase-like glycosyltransferase
MWYPDEPDIGEVVRAMYLSGDWIAPRRMGVIWVDYPPLLYWAGATSAHLLGGVSEFAFRLPNALTAIALVVLTCVVGTRWFGPRVGLWAGLLLLTFQQYVLQAVGFRPDLPFSLAITGGLVCYAAGAGERPRWYLRVAGFVLLGVAMLAKGPLGLLLPGLVLTLWHVARREWRRIIELAPLSLVALAVYLSWFVACARAMGADNILYELYAQNFARFVAADRGHAQPIYYFFQHIWLDLLPWSVLLPFALHWVHRAGLWRDRNVQLLLWWAGAFMVFLSFAATKRQLYMLPAYPAFALLMAPWLAAVGRTEGGEGPSLRPARAFGWFVVVLLVLLAVVLFAAAISLETIARVEEFTPPEIESGRLARLPAIGLGFVLLASAVWIGLAARGRRIRELLRRTAAAHVVIYLVMLAWLLPTFNATKTYKPAAEWMRDQMGTATHFGLMFPEADFGFRKMGAFGYYSGKLVVLLDDRADVEDFFVEHPDSVALVISDEVEELFANDPAAWRERVVRDDLYAGARRYVVVRRPSMQPPHDSPEGG